MQVIIIEFIDETLRLLAKYGEDYFRRDDVLVVSLHPKVRAYLETLKIASVDTIAYLDNDAQHRIILKSERWTLQLVDAVELRDEFDIVNGYRETLIRHLRLQINHYLWLVEIINNIYLKHKVKKMITCLVADEDAMYCKEGYIQDEERFLGFIARDFCSFHSVIFEPTTIEFDGEKADNRVFKKLLDFVVGTIARVNSHFKLSSINQNQDIVVVPGLSYRLDSLMAVIKENHRQVATYMVWESGDSLKQQLYKLYLLMPRFLKRSKKDKMLDAVFHLDFIEDQFVPTTESNTIKNQLEHWIDLINRDETFSFEYLDINIKPYIHNKIRSGLKVQMLRLHRRTMALARLFQTIKPKLLISMYSSDIYYMMGELAQYQNFDSLNISHGTHVPPHNEYEHIENYRLATSVISNSYRTVAVQTPWAEKFLDYYKDERERVISGPLLYSVVSQEERSRVRSDVLNVDKDTKVILYATTQKARDSFRFHITETLDEFISSIKDIVNMINQMDNVLFVIRPHPACDLSEEEFRRLIPQSDKIKIVKSGPFAPLLSASDLLISYSSTCIEEAVQNNIPVVMYDKWRRYNHFDVQELACPEICKWQPAYYVSTPNQLSNCVYFLLGVSKNFSIDENICLEYKYLADTNLNIHNYINRVLSKKPISAVKEKVKV